MPTLSLDVPVELIKDPRSWTDEEVSVWLHWLGIGEHREAFLARGVDGRVLLQLSAESAWSDLGVVDPAQQRVLESAVEPLRCFHDSEGAETGLWFEAIEGPVAGEVFFVGAGGITGGRHSASNDIVLSENYVSRQHFQITRDRGGQHLLQDVGSTTGTFIMVREELPLSHGMVLQLGTTELTVYIDGDECTLVATEGPDKDARATVSRQGLFIGREASNGLCVRDPQISAVHAEVRRAGDQGFVLDDQRSTNRTWLRLSPDGQPSMRFVLHAGDLFKVGSTMFHVADPTSLPEVTTFGPQHRPSARQGSLPLARMPRPAAEHGNLDEEGFDGNGPAAAVGAASRPLYLELESGLAQPPASVVAGSLIPGGGDSVVTGGVAGPPQLRWEPVLDGEERLVLDAAEYARRLTASRRRMVEAASSRQGATDAQGTGHHTQDLRERELASLQQRMRNSRAQTAYTLQQQRQEERRDEDLCKICYDRDIDVVLYPCGHFVLCRWCAQKVSDCPVCRFVITDVIRTYKA